MGSQSGAGEFTRFIISPDFKILPQKSFYIAKMECSKFKLLVAPKSWKRKN